MPINLGLTRMLKLLKLLGNPQESFLAVQVAGTNGKGSICTYIYTSLLQASYKVGRYTSPYFVDPRDSISINGSKASKVLFNECWNKVNETNLRHHTEATEFELLTATAFECFHRSNVRIAVIETGLGGRLDATNVFEEPLVSVLAKIGLDHQFFLGNTLAEIAREKAGIMKAKVPCVIDGTNDPTVLDAVRQVAESLSAGPVHAVTAQPVKDDEHKWIVNTPNWGENVYETSLNGAYQGANLACAVTALDIISNSVPLMLPHVVAGLKHTHWPGRLDIQELPDVGRIVFDGAHNENAAIELSKYIEEHRKPGQSVTWVMAFTSTKDVLGIIKTLVKPGDCIAATTFPDVAGMPWIHAKPTASIAKIAASLNLPCEEFSDNWHGAIDYAVERTPNNVIVCGSLYLLGRVFLYYGLE
ncbi:folylpolyglutamate synthase [Schizosaccharomyces japonicus yFS275]|uniref:Dihydrofolate synthetase n=1 Tax=Schizosaccharomyces japonicus (strain yFS275 / FY16936) TaxID=402676 RepID=B6JVW2_SCHJY|nr:folylpolyglutamate synthase [Schizosaccharomyces japonicus yFS275]EEB05513.1 folylpolyglutamate synthase [Schizosaccharomyces japonicus yFS275]